MKRLFVIGFVAVGVGACEQAAKPPVPTWDDAGASASASAPASASASVSASAAASASASAPPPSGLGTCPAYDPKDLPEPVSPRVECLFRREVRCVAQSPALSAWQRWFPFCPMEGKAWADGIVPTKALFSAQETCKKPDQCCYVQFVATACR